MSSGLAQSNTFMTEMMRNRPVPQQPHSQDAVLGGSVGQPATGAVLGGLTGVKQRLASPLVEQRVAALAEAMRHGQAGLDLVIGALGDRALPVQTAAYALLKDLDHPRVVDAVRQFTVSSLKRRFDSDDEGDQIAALADVTALGHEGLDLLLQVLPTASDVLQRAIYHHLCDRPEARAQKVLEFFSSEGSSYLRLRDFLLQKQWQAADRETLRLLLGSQGGTLTAERISALPCRDLHRLDQLWVQASSGRFGFSVQADIWMPFAQLFWSKADTWAAVGDRLGWRINHPFNPNHWKRYSEISFRPRAPKGHLPFLGDPYGIFTLEAFAKRLQACNRASEDWVEDTV
jgi:hypothetical protein